MFSSDSQRRAAFMKMNAKQNKFAMAPQFTSNVAVEQPVAEPTFVQAQVMQPVQESTFVELPFQVQQPSTGKVMTGVLEKFAQGIVNLFPDTYTERHDKIQAEIQPRINAVANLYPERKEGMPPITDLIANMVVDAFPDGDEAIDGYGEAFVKGKNREYAQFREVTQNVQ